MGLIYLFAVILERGKPCPIAEKHRVEQFIHLFNQVSIDQSLTILRFLR